VVYALLVYGCQVCDFEDMVPSLSGRRFALPSN